MAIAVVMTLQVITASSEASMQLYDALQTLAAHKHCIRETMLELDDIYITHSCGGPQDGPKFIYVTDLAAHAAMQ